MSLRGLLPSWPRPRILRAKNRSEGFSLLEAFLNNLRRQPQEPR
jgi:hypothetical protein